MQSGSSVSDLLLSGAGASPALLAATWLRRSLLPQSPGPCHRIYSQAERPLAPRPLLIVTLQSRSLKKACGSQGSQSHRGNGSRRWGKRGQGLRDGGIEEPEIKEAQREGQQSPRGRDRSWRRAWSVRNPSEVSEMTIGLAGVAQ